MDYKDITKIVEKYWAGETTLEEERFLKSYFEKDEVEEELKSQQHYFQMLNQQKEIGLSDTFEEQLMAKLTNTETPKKEASIKQFDRNIFLVRIAAAALILISIYFLLPKTLIESNTTVAMEETFETPEEALAETRKILLLVSSKMNKGTNQAAKGILKMQETSNIFKLK